VDEESEQRDDLRTTARIRNPRLYDAARKEAAKSIPLGNRWFWKKTLEIYQRLGGKLESEPLQEDKP
jgi:hypothetical protein